MIVEDLPAHLEAGPLVRDPVDSATLYAGFVTRPLSEIWRRAAEREGAFCAGNCHQVSPGAGSSCRHGPRGPAALRGLGQFYRHLPGVRCPHGPPETT